MKLSNTAKAFVASLIVAIATFLIAWWHFNATATEQDTFNFSAFMAGIVALVVFILSMTASLIFIFAHKKSSSSTKLPRIAVTVIFSVALLAALAFFFIV